MVKVKIHMNAEVFSKVFEYHAEISEKPTNQKQPRICKIREKSCAPEKLHKLHHVNGGLLVAMCQRRFGLKRQRILCIFWNLGKAHWPIARSRSCNAILTARQIACSISQLRGTTFPRAGLETNMLCKASVNNYHLDAQCHNAHSPDPPVCTTR